MSSTARSKVLIVEDDADIGESIAEILDLEGFLVDRARNGKEALDRLQTAPASIILLDLMMPVMDGFQFQSALRKIPKYDGIPIIVMSADGHMQEKKSRIGAVEYLRKPIDVDVLVGAVRRYC